MNHILTEKNMETMTAVCAVDGPVSIRSKGTGRFQCAVKKTLVKRAYNARHPERARLHRQTRSAHRVTGFDGKTMTAHCPACDGMVGVVVKGRRRKDGTPGVMCANRAKELWPNGRTETTQERCPTCRRVYLDADGGCRYCDDREENEVGYGLLVAEAVRKEAEWANEAFDGELPYIYNLAETDPRLLDGDTVSNPALKVIGDGVPAGMAKKKFVDSWWAQNGHLV